jgi:hypothetical protein
MSRTKNRARKGLEAQPLREASKEERKKQQEAKKSKREKKAFQQANKPLQTSPTEKQDDSITGPSTTSLPTTSSPYLSTAITPYGDLDTTHTVTFISIISSTSIEKKVTATLTHLSTFPAVSPAKEAVVMLHSKAKVASKLITVVEIAKREVAAGGGKWFQYNVVGTVMEEQKENAISGIEKGSKEGEEDESGDEEEETGFETMKTPFERAIEGKSKVRAVQTMTTYLSRVRIEGLRKTYG